MILLFFQAPEILCRTLSLSLGFSSCGLVWDCQFAFSCLGQISYKESMEKKREGRRLPAPGGRDNVGWGRRHLCRSFSPSSVCMSVPLFLRALEGRDQTSFSDTQLLTALKLHLFLSFSAHLGELTRKPGCSLPWRWRETLALSTTRNPTKPPVLVFSSCFGPGWGSCPTLPRTAPSM